MATWQKFIYALKIFCYTGLIFTKLVLPRQIFVGNPYTEFNENPTLFYYWYYVTDRETDRWTEGRMDRSGARVRRPFVPRLIIITCTV